VDPTLLRAYRFEVITQANFALEGYNRLCDLARAFVPGVQLVEMGPMVIQGVGPFQQFLVGAGVISLILFPRQRDPGSPKGQRSLDRGEELRHIWAVSDDSALANRDLRNSLEHIDERLEEWIDSEKPVRFSPFALVPSLDYLRSTGGDAIRVWIGVRPWKFIVYGKELNAEVLAKEIKDLTDRLGPNTVTFEGKHLS
jgi:hypothetical protein